MNRLPSVRTLSTVFAHNAREARRVLEMSRTQLEQLPACQQRLAECYHAPRTWDLRMTALNLLADTCGVESVQLGDGEYLEYLNAGDTFAPTLLRHRGRYRVAAVGDVIERERI